jgi:hypothetical protein
LVGDLSEGEVPGHEEEVGRRFFLAKSDPVRDPSSRIPATGILFAIRSERHQQLQILYGFRFERHRQFGSCPGSELNATVNWDPVRDPI